MTPILLAGLVGTAIVCAIFGAAIVHRRKRNPEGVGRLSAGSDVYRVYEAHNTQIWFNPPSRKGGALFARVPGVKGLETFSGNWSVFDKNGVKRPRKVQDFNWMGPPPTVARDELVAFLDFALERATFINISFSEAAVMCSVGLKENRGIEAILDQFAAFAVALGTDRVLGPSPDLNEQLETEGAPSGASVGFPSG